MNMKYRSRKRYGHGGNIDDKKAMILSQIKEVHHHADELAEVVAKMDTVDAWVVGKMERATTDLSDITHYLDGTTEYADGGMMSDNTFDNILTHYGFKKTKTFSGKRFFSGGKNKEIFASVDDKLKEVRVETNDVTIYSGYSIFDLMYILNRNRNLFLADGGMMARGGNVRSLLKNFNEEKPTIALIMIADDVSNDFMKEKFDKKIKWNELSDGEKQKYNEDYKVNKSKFDTYLMYEFVKLYYSDDKIKQKCKGSGTKTLNAIKSVMIDLAKKYDDSKYEDGGMMARGGKTYNQLLEDFNVDDLDDFESMRFEQMTNNGVPKATAIELLINEVEGDYSQLSPSLVRVAKKQNKMMARGGEVRYKLKGNNFGDQIENGRKFKVLIEKAFNNQSGETRYPLNFISETAFTGKIVKHDGKNYLKDYSYKGTLSKFDFLDDKDFIEALKYVDRPAIRKFEDGGIADAPEIEIDNDEGTLKVYYTKGDIGFDGTLKKYHSGRDFEYEFEPDDFDNQESEDFYYNDGDNVIENEILDYFYSNYGKMEDGGMMADGEVIAKEGDYTFVYKNLKNNVFDYGNSKGILYSVAPDEEPYELGYFTDKQSAIEYLKNEIEGEGGNLTLMARGGEVRMLNDYIKDLQRTIQDKEEFRNELSSDLSDFEKDMLENRLNDLRIKEDYLYGQIQFLLKNYLIKNGKPFTVSKKTHEFLQSQGFAKGGKVNYEYIPKYEIESINTWDGENIEEKDILDGAYVKRKRKR